MSLSVSFRGAAEIAGAPLFPEIELNLEAGRWTCLLGPSGAGKSTVLRLIAGLETGARFRGRIQSAPGSTRGLAARGRPSRGVAPGRARGAGALAGRVAFMAQSDLLFPWLSALDNVALGARLRGERPDLDRARELIARVGLAAHEAKRPAALSGGERQRAALARTLMEDRPLILLDEPFSALDARTRAEMQALAWELLAGRTVLLVTHDPAEAARMGHAIHVLTREGLSTAPAPASPPIRAVDDPEALAAQGALLRLLMAAA